MLPALRPVIAAFVLALTPQSFAEPDSQLPWSPSDGEVLDFDVTRNGKSFGEHTVRFAVSDGEIKVRNDIELEASLGPIRVFYYAHESDEIWVNGRLSQMDGVTKKDGDTLTLDVEAQGDVLLVDGSGYEGEVPLDIVPSSHWNLNQIKSQKILSSENGEILDVKVEKVGTETVKVGDETLTADRYRLVSDLTVDLWYDQSGRWVKCQFEARGQSIEYHLKG